MGLDFHQGKCLCYCTINKGDRETRLLDLLQFGAFLRVLKQKKQNIYFWLLTGLTFDKGGRLLLEHCVLWSSFNLFFMEPHLCFLVFWIICCRIIQLELSTTELYIGIFCCRNIHFVLIFHGRSVKILWDRMMNNVNSML